MANSQLSVARETITTRDDEGSHDSKATHVGSITPSDSVDQLKVGKHVCPEEYANAFTPMEFEEVGGFDAETELSSLQSTPPGAIYLD